MKSENEVKTESNFAKCVRIFGQIIFVIIIIALLGWILFVDFPAIKNYQNWFDAVGHLTYGILHSLLLIWATIMLLIFKK